MRSVLLCALASLAGFSTARSQCDDMSFFDGVVSGEVDLGSATSVECVSDNEVVIASGETVTIVSTQPVVRFFNIRFTVMEGASLIFDMPETQLAPNGVDEPATGNIQAFRVHDTATLTFMGKFEATELSHSLMYNSGTTEFKDEAVFTDNVETFYINTGILKFRGDALFQDNEYHGIDNRSTGFVRFSKKATFINNGFTYDDTSGCGLENYGGTVIFRGDVVFSDHQCREGAALYNSGKMRFYSKAYFNDNESTDVEGGAELGTGAGFINNFGGDAIFKGAVQFNRNSADQIGGGLFVGDGDVQFNGWTTFADNSALVNGGAFAVTGGSVTFKNPSRVSGSGNTVDAAGACTFGYVEDGTVVGFEDVCDEANLS
ncbi:unnamed protein product [Scytosiphon promiscuus]